MPLFMDLHIIEGITIDEVKEAHVADKAVEEQYDVNLIQFWVNKDAGTVMCLIEAPNKESCEAVHQESHGNIACNIEKVEPGFYQLFMGKNHQLDHGLVKHDDGTVDLGYRFVLDVDIQRHIDNINSSNFKRLVLPENAKEFALAHIKNFGGKEVEIDTDDDLIAVFMESKTALACAVELQRELSKKSSNPEDPAWNISFKIGVTGGQPLTEKRGFFEEVIRTGKRLSFAADNQEILVSPIIKRLSGIEETSTDSHLRILSNSEAGFLDTLFDSVEENIANNDFSVDLLSRNIGMSRPQLYRKTKSAAGRPPSRFIRDLRMRKALSLIRKQQYNISEIALKVGINNPSYFSKCFNDKYGISPSKVKS